MPLTNPPINPNKKIEKNEKEKSEKVNIEKGQPEVLDSRKEFFRLMAEKIKDKDFNINQAIAFKEEINKREESVNNREESEKNIGDGQSFIKENNKTDDKREDFVYINENQKNEDAHSSNKQPVQSIYLYRKMIYRFLFLASLLLVAVFYFSFVSMTIVVYSEEGNVDSDLTFYAHASDNLNDLNRAVRASIGKIEIEKSGSFQSTGEKNRDGEIVGRVRIVNQHSRAQSLVATTRLLSSDDKLFRIRDSVNVPAGGSVEVDIYTDSPSEEMAIGPGRFTIPGLWIGLQDQIYAENLEAFEYRVNSIKYISEDDMKNAITSLKEKIAEEARMRSEEVVEAGKSYVFDISTDASINSDKKIGEEAPVFNISLKSTVSVISFKTDDLLELAKQKVSLEADRDVLEINNDSLNFNLINYDPEKSLAEIKVYFSARTSVDIDSFINKNHLTNLNKDQIEAYLDNFPEIKSHELIFRPNFIQRSPILADKIKIEYR